MINNQRFVIPMSNAQSMVNGQAGDLTAHVVLLVNQEPKSEPEFALVHFMVENIALEITNNQRFVIPMSNAQLMVNGQACLLYTSPSPRDLSTSRMPSSA